MKVQIRGTNEIVLVFPNPALSAELAAWRETDCEEHPRTELRRRVTSNGGFQVRRQCLDCGHVLGGALKQQPGHEALPEVDTSLREHYDQGRQRQYDDIYQKHALLQKARETEWFKRYSAYLETGVWKKKRALVLARSGGICEGCREVSATEVHHLTYKHMGDEFLFELVAVCTACHARLHEGEIEGPPEDFQFEESDDRGNRD